MGLHVFTSQGPWFRLGWLSMAGLTNITQAFFQMARVRETSSEMTLESRRVFCFWILLPFLSCFSIGPVRRAGQMFSVSPAHCGQERISVVSGAWWPELSHFLSCLCPDESILLQKAPDVGPESQGFGYSLVLPALSPRGYIRRCRE